MSDTPFRANPASTLLVSAATAAGGAINLSGAPVGGPCTVRVRNKGTVDAYVEFGKASVVATVPGATPGSLSLAPGAVEFFSLDHGQKFVAVAVATGAPSVEVTTGNGG